MIRNQINHRIQKTNMETDPISHSDTEISLLSHLVLSRESHFMPPPPKNKATKQKKKSPMAFMYMRKYNKINIKWGSALSDSEWSPST